MVLDGMYMYTISVSFHSSSSLFIAMNNLLQSKVALQAEVHSRKGRKKILGVAIEYSGCRVGNY